MTPQQPEEDDEIFDHKEEFIPVEMLSDDDKKELSNHYISDNDT